MRKVRWRLGGQRQAGRRAGDHYDSEMLPLFRCLTRNEPPQAVRSCPTNSPPAEPHLQTDPPRGWSETRTLNERPDRFVVSLCADGRLQTRSGGGYDTLKHHAMKDLSQLLKVRR